MTRAEMIEKANVIRERDQFGAMTPEEVAALPGTDVEMQIPVRDGRTVRVYEVRPDAPLEKGCPMIINFHGGGFIKVRSDRDRRYCVNMATYLNCLVWDVDYSLAPEYPFPTAVHEAYDILAYVFDHAEEIGVDVNRIALAGHSAGGSLVAAALIQAAGNEKIKPCCALMEYFVADLTVPPAEKLTPELKADPKWVQRAGVEEQYNLFYASPDQVQDPLVSSVLASDEVMATFPPSMVLAAGMDTLRLENEAFAARLARLGVPVTACTLTESMHGFTINLRPGWEKAYELHKRFFKSYMY